MRFSRLAIPLSLFFSGVPSALPAPCCSSSSAAPAILSGDDRMQFTALSARSSVIGDVSPAGRSVFRPSNESEVTRTFRLDGAFVFADRFQANASVPFLQREVQKGASENASNGFGDLRFGLTYEALPEWSYSAWKPKGFTFLQMTLPTGRPIDEATTLLATDALGQGFYGLTGGALFTKAFGNWDHYAIPEVTYSFSRAFDSVRKGPRWSGSFAWGSGYNFAFLPLRVGLRLQPTWAASQSITNADGPGRTAPQRNWNTALELAYLLGEEWTLFGAYTDQTLLGPARASTLSRVATVGLQRRFGR